MEKDLHSGIKTLIALDVGNITTDTTTDGNVIDTVGFEGLEYSIQSGTITDGTYALLLEESDVVTFGGEETVVPAANILGVLTGFVAANDDVTLRVGSIGKKRFQRLAIVSASTSTGGTNFTAQAILGFPKSGPVAE